MHLPVGVAALLCAPYAVAWFCAPTSCCTSTLHQSPAYRAHSSIRARLLQDARAHVDATYGPELPSASALIGYSEDRAPPDIQQLMKRARSTHAAASGACDGVLRSPRVRSSEASSRPPSAAAATSAARKQHSAAPASRARHASSKAATQSAQPQRPASGSNGAATGILPGCSATADRKSKQAGRLQSATAISEAKKALAIQRRGSARTGEPDHAASATSHHASGAASKSASPPSAPSKQAQARPVGFGLSTVAKAAQQADGTSAPRSSPPGHIKRVTRRTADSTASTDSIGGYMAPLPVQQDDRSR